MTIFQALISYHKEEPNAIVHQPVMPKVAQPEELTCMYQVMNDIMGLLLDNLYYFELQFIKRPSQ